MDKLGLSPKNGKVKNHESVNPDSPPKHHTQTKLCTVQVIPTRHISLHTHTKTQTQNTHMHGWGRHAKKKSSKIRHTMRQ